MKKILLTLFVWILWFWCFCSAWTYTFEWDWNSLWRFVPAMSNISKNVTMTCTFTNSNTNCDGAIFRTKFALVYFTNSSLNTTYYWDVSSDYELVCWSNDTFTFTYNFANYIWSPWYSYKWFSYMYLSSTRNPDPYYISYTCVFSGDTIIDWSNTWWWSCPECPEINTWEILSWYILESEVDTNYCVWNWLCPNECWSWTDFSWDLVFSNLYINNILHPWKSNIFVEIPDYITWDYSTDTWSFNLYVWSWYDVDYINSIIDINSYRPDSKDFTDIFVWGLTLITPYIVICLFFFLIWKLLRRIFK